MRSIAFATYRGAPELPPGDRLAAELLGERGMEVRTVCWDDREVRWSALDAIVVRSCWDYTERLDEFLEWADRVAERSPLWNPAPLLRWNATKTYLRDLEQRGIPIVPTVWLEPGGRPALAELVDERGWQRFVLKPLVSASAAGTVRLTMQELRRGQEHLDVLLRDRGALLQPFLPEIESDGEWSFVFFSGSYSHAVVKRPRAGDFRVQHEHGGSVRRRHAPVALLAQASVAARALPGPWLLARVDGVVVDGQLLVMEIECIEPELFLAGDRQLAGAFADAVVAVHASTGR